MVLTEEKSFFSILGLILLNRRFAGVNSSKASQGCHIMVYDSHYSKKNDKKFIFKKIYAKNDDHTMILVWIMENMVIIAWSCHESWRSCQETCPACRHHGKIMAWQPCFSNSGLELQIWHKNVIKIQNWTHWESKRKNFKKERCIIYKFHSVSWKISGLVYPSRTYVQNFSSMKTHK